MNHSVMVHGTLLGVALIAAFLVWTREPSTTDEDTIAVLSLPALDRVTYEEEERKVEIARKEDDIGKYQWITVKTLQTVRTPPHRLPSSPPAPSTANPARSAASAAIKPAGRKPAGIKRIGTKPGPRAKRAARAKPSAKAKPGAKAKPAVKATPAAKRPKPSKDPASLAQDPKADPTPNKAATPKPAAAKAAAAKPTAAKPTTTKHTPAKPAPRAVPPNAPGRPAANAAPAAGAAAAASTPAAPPSGAKPASPKPPAPKKEWRTKAFKGNEAAEELIKTLGHLPAVRALGRLGKEKLKEFKLTGSKSKLTLVSGDTKRVFVIGGRTYGNMDYYIMDESDGRVYVVKQKPLQDLKHAEFRLYDRELHSFDAKDVERAVVQVGAKTKTLAQHNREKPSTAFWTDAEAADQSKGNDSYRNWMNKLFHLRTLEYTDPTAPPRHLKERLRVVFKRGSKQLGSLVISEATPQPKSPVPGMPAPVTAPAEFYAKTDNTHIPVKLSKTLAEGVVKDVESVLKD